MPETKSKQRPAVAKRATARKTGAAQGKRNTEGAVRRTTELSDDVFASLDESARSAIDAVRRFTETVDRALPGDRDGRSRAEEVTDSALEMAQRLVHTQAEFLRKVVDSTGRSLGGPRKGK
jgi:hypothetical protein